MHLKSSCGRSYFPIVNLKLKDPASIALNPKDLSVSFSDIYGDTSLELCCLNIWLTFCFVWSGLFCILFLIQIGYVRFNRSVIGGIAKAYFIGKTSGGRTLRWIIKHEWLRYWCTLLSALTRFLVQ